MDLGQTRSHTKILRDSMLSYFGSARGGTRTYQIFKNAIAQTFSKMSTKGKLGKSLEQIRVIMQQHHLDRALKREQLSPHDRLMVMPLVWHSPSRRQSRKIKEA